LPELTPALDAERREIDERAGRLSYYVAGEGSPMLLIHSINAAGSAYEIRPIFEHFRQRNRVYAPDLPGFGFSDRSRRDYDVALYTDSVRDMIDQIEKDTDGESIDALALSLSSEFLARAADDDARGLRSLALITPTGFRKGSDELREPTGSTREMRWLSAILEFPLWRKGLYGLLTRPRTIRYFLKRTWGSSNYDEGLAEYDDQTTDQPGAENAPYAFLSGRLFSKDIRSVYERLDLPVWLAHGTKGDFRDFRGARWTEEKPNWRRTAFDTGALPHFEAQDTFMSRYEGFLQGLG
jgi:pimeloyl-ACP methyl ester carboxylesterase